MVHRVGIYALTVLAIRGVRHRATVNALTLAQRCPYDLVLVMWNQAEPSARAEEPASIHRCHRTRKIHRLLPSPLYRKDARTGEGPDGIAAKNVAEITAEDRPVRPEILRR